MPIPAKSSDAQAIYLKELHNLARAEYRKKTVGSPPKTFPFPIDPQGRVILDVKLDDESWERIHAACSEQPVQVHSEALALFKKQFIAKLGHPIQEITSVSWDLQTKHAEAANTALHSALKLHLPEKESTDILDKYQGLAKGRIISLQQETHFHAHLIGRMVEKAVYKATDSKPPHETPEQRIQRVTKFGNTSTQFQVGIEKALLTLNKSVLDLQAKALEKAYAKANKKEPFDQETFATVLNEELDKARKKLLPEIAKTIRIELIKATGIQFNKEITQHLSKHLAEATSGSANDFVHIDKGTGFISFIGASERTSHHQELGGDHLADRMMYSHHLKDDATVVALSDRQQVRVPSIAVKKLHSVTKELLKQDASQKTLTIPVIDERIDGLDPKGKLSIEERQQIKKEYEGINKILYKNHGDAVYADKEIKDAFNQLVVQDTVDKISYLQDKYKLGGDTRLEPVDPENKLPRAFVYNLYTTLNKKDPAGRIDERANKQSQSADHILEAAHLYNRQNAVKPGVLGKPLCLVQNMAVNGWGHELSIKDGNPPLVNEAALMTQMATLHTIYDALVGDDKKVVRQLFEDYNKFLNSEGTSFYAYLKTQPESPGLTKLEQLKKFMTVPQTIDSTIIAGITPHRVAFTANAKAALASLFKEGAFGHAENGFTYQALSVFVQKSSMGGCKSANERAQAVNGRVSILDFVSLDKVTRDALLTNYLSPEEAQKVRELSDNLERNIMLGNTAAITKHLDDLYGSLNLEGFQAVISFIDQGGHAKLGTKGVMPNTNNSETVKTHVDKASKWQCHKDLIDNVLNEFGGIEKISYGKEFGKIAKAIGLASIGGAIAGAGAFGIALAVGASIAFPPIGIAIGLGVAVAAGVAAIGALGSFIYKLATKNSATKERFGKLQEENTALVAERTTEIQAQRDRNIAPAQASIVNPPPTVVAIGDWRTPSSISSLPHTDQPKRALLSQGVMKNAINEGRSAAAVVTEQEVAHKADESTLGAPP